MGDKTGIEWTDATWQDKAAAARIGISSQEYAAHIAIGEKWCTSCKKWHSRGIFPVDRSRCDGLAPSCRGYRPSRRPRTLDQKREVARVGYRKYYAGAGGPAIRARVYARKRKTGAILPEVRELIFEQFDGECAYCGKSATTVDHIAPVRDGGESVRGNLLPSCTSCNSSKKTQSLEAFLLVAKAPNLHGIMNELSMAEAL